MHCAFNMANLDFGIDSRSACCPYSVFSDITPGLLWESGCPILPRDSSSVSSTLPRLLHPDPVLGHISAVETPFSFCPGFSLKKYHPAGYSAMSYMMLRFFWRNLFTWWVPNIIVSHKPSIVVFTEIVWLNWLVAHIIIIFPTFLEVRISSMLCGRVFISNIVVFLRFSFRALQVSERTLWIVTFIAHNRIFT